MRRYKGYVAKTGNVFSKLNKDAVRSADNLPKRPFIRQGADHSSIPSKKPSFGQDATARNSMVEKVRRGEIEDSQGREVLRKATCLAPAYNKGAYQYVGSTEMAQEAGRKTPKGSER